MAERKTVEQKLTEIDTKLRQLAAQKKSLLARSKEKEHKERTRRLIE